MFCPRCGQEQISDNTRFCSRCGFLLETVSEVLANGGVLPQLMELSEKKAILTRKNGLVISFFWFTSFVLILALLFAILDLDTLAGMSLVIGVFGSIMWLFASLVLFKRPSKAFPQEPAAPHFYRNIQGSSQNALPPQQSIPVSSYAPPVGKWQDTNSLAVPPSVTESTTKLLQKDE